MAFRLISTALFALLWRLTEGKSIRTLNRVIATIILLLLIHTRWKVGFEHFAVVAAASTWCAINRITNACVSTIEGL